MHLSKMEWIALVIVFVIGLHFYNKHQMENDAFEETVNAPLYTKDDHTPVIVAFGDSLTAGTGISEEESYPAQLSRLLGIEVINAGVYGETTARALGRLPAILKRYKPDIVLLEEGMNDVLHKRERETIKKNLKKMVGIIKKSGAKAVILGIPDMDLIELMISSDIGLYEEVARETGSLYIANVFGPVLRNEELKSDYTHPNGAGYHIVAQKIYEELGDMLP
ncbi:GDSL-type esterase/lipase family protein [Hydrogenimonas urashimensis]|uniref:GDSL-type esterase/lipase family protein n=1 Tax=Hydrogenimonas urashimensis TaxID=2740515 RepID=UPI0019167A42|nr:GDSL-type esterase/lipase family protein [Hydrogenimonas urashimensis]